ncbi:MAG: DUF2892 domain-containing protein [Haloarcula sp.]
MDTEQNVGGRDRLIRAVLAVILTIVSLRWLRSGKRKRGLLAGIGALGLGFNAARGYCGVNESLNIDTTDRSDDLSDPLETTDSESTDVEVEFTTDEPDTTKAHSNGTLTCAVCEDPIVPGERRGPNEDGAVVHESCE